MNLANKLTLFRIILVPFFVAFMLIDEIPYNYLLALIIFAVASVTDFLDGYIARKYNMITSFGKFLDPIADKVLVVSALVCFVELGWTGAWVVVVIIAREFIVSGIRLAAVESEDKTVISAGFLGKLKTAVTMVVICWFLIIMTIYFDFKINYFDISPDFNMAIVTTTSVLMYTCAFLTVISGVQYAWQYRHVFKSKN
ncbi:MAG: CDP-diacylglycerol--glycerol-3-phosphate 3-phosphatidyltransferase [Oscillospiraceae bacterium]|nr:CDP-diacylglycerol--glycerol-3-phosphate 3-phosphatidyltransferase [Oscillospiraceae bacterium]